MIRNPWATPLMIWMRTPPKSQQQIHIKKKEGELMVLKNPLHAFRGHGVKSVGSAQSDMVSPCNVQAWLDCTTTSK